MKEHQKGKAGELGANIKSKWNEITKHIKLLPSKIMFRLYTFSLKISTKTDQDKYIFFCYCLKSSISCSMYEPMTENC